jgi:hypothetical protein
MEITLEERALVGKTKKDEGVEWKLGIRRLKGEERLVWVFGKMVRRVSKQEIDILLGGGTLEGATGPSAPKRTTKVGAKDVKSDPLNPAPGEPTTNLLDALIKTKGSEQAAKDLIQKAKLGKRNISVDGRTLTKSYLNEETPLAASAKVRDFAIVGGG